MILKKYFHFSGKKVFYTDQGNGTPIMLIHGYLETSEIWESFAAKLAGTYRVLAIDLPGHGQSDIYNSTHSMEFMASVAEGLMNNTGVDRAFVVGHSMGGYVTLAFLEMVPHKLSGYCLFHSHPFADSTEVLKRRENEINMVEAGKKFMLYPDTVRRMYADSNFEKHHKEFERSKRIASEISSEGITAVLRGMMTRPSRVHVMEEGKVPCLWILGEKDNYIQCEQMKSRVKLPPNAELVILNDSGHIGFIEEEEKSLIVLNNFLSKIN
ncbi:MAG: alpha/beta fold hydrolase [Bacteroidales bacterium]